MKTKITHYAIGSRYMSRCEDRMMRTMVPIACTGTRTYLPRGHDATHSTKITCRVCLEKLIGHWESEVALLKESLVTSVLSETKFKISMRERGRERLRQWFDRAPEPDRETLERLKS